MVANKYKHVISQGPSGTIGWLIEIYTKIWAGKREALGVRMWMTVKGSLFRVLTGRFYKSQATSLPAMGVDPVDGQELTVVKIHNTYGAESKTERILIFTRKPDQIRRFSSENEY